ncbi:acid-sensing ion channel 2-like, partial [Saccoglossus kowalevskii]
EVYFEELNYESIEEIPAITEENLLSDIGGTLGLYCGFSFITIVEFLQFGFELLRVIFLRSTKLAPSNNSHDA